MYLNTIFSKMLTLFQCPLKRGKVSFNLLAEEIGVQLTGTRGRVPPTEMSLRDMPITGRSRGLLPYFATGLNLYFGGKNSILFFG